MNPGKIVAVDLTGGEQRRATLNRLYLTIGGLIVIALFAALIAPWFINWDDYKANFEAEAEKDPRPAGARHRLRRREHPAPRRPSPSPTSRSARPRASR